MYWDVKTVRPLDDYEIYVELEDGRKGVFDLKPYLNHGVFQELQDERYFAQVGIVLGAVAWPHEQDIAPETLVAGLKPAELDAETRFRIRAERGQGKTARGLALLEKAKGEKQPA